MKKAIVALAFAGSSFLALSGATADAGARHQPFFWDGCGPGLKRHCLGPDRDLLIDRLERYRVTCDEARRIVRNQGYRNVRVQVCGGPNHVFKAQWKGKTYIVMVSQRHGHISSVKRVKA